MTNRSLSALVEFLDWLAKKGLMNQETASSRKTACNKVLGILGAEELTDVTTIDLEDAMTRFINLEGRNYNPASLNVYRSRVASALADFGNYLANPAGFKPNAGARRGAETQNRNHEKPSRKQPHRDEATPRPEGSNAPSAHVFPIPIRADVTVRIHGLPFDLTGAEADRIANVVKALATSEA